MNTDARQRKEGSDNSPGLIVVRVSRIAVFVALLLFSSVYTVVEADA